MYFSHRLNKFFDLALRDPLHLRAPGFSLHLQKHSQTEALSIKRSIPIEHHYSFTIWWWCLRINQFLPITKAGNSFPRVNLLSHTCAND